MSNISDYQLPESYLNINDREIFNSYKSNGSGADYIHKLKQWEKNYIQDLKESEEKLERLLTWPIGYLDKHFIPKNSKDLFDELDRIKDSIYSYVNDLQGGLYSQYPKQFYLHHLESDLEKAGIPVTNGITKPLHRVFNEACKFYLKAVHINAIKNAIDYLEEQTEVKPKERPVPQNEMAQKMYKTKESNRPKKEAIIKKAVELINETDKEYRTPKNNCQRWLYNHPKIKVIDKGNARGWLDNAIKDGTINRKLKELPME